MPKIPYVKKKLGEDKLYMISQANRILDDYAEQGFTLTLRQVYYQFVARDLFGDDKWYVNVGGNKWVRSEQGAPGATKNAEPNYKYLGDVLTDGRMGGYIDWNHLEDRTRELTRLAHWNDPAHIVREVRDQFRIEKWADQPDYVEVWIEKDALEGVIEPTCEALDVPFFSCRGYTSLSEMWVASQRLRDKIEDGKRVTILHLGDHDPSGIDMTRDIEDRLCRFLANDHYRLTGYDISGEQAYTWAHEWLSIDRIALNMNQIRQYDPPPNPAKIGDSRARSYIREYGRESWELDALEPTVLSALIENAVLELRDEDLWDAAVAREAKHRETLAAASDRWDEVADLLDS